MNEARDAQLRETSWRRPLTDAEQAELRVWLAAHPEALADWQAEAGLNAALKKLPDAPVPTNFTRHVLQEIERVDAADQSSAGFWRSVDWRRWLPRTVVAPTLVVVAVVVFLQIQRADARAKVGQSLAAMASVEAAPPPIALKDFEPIERLQNAFGADKELLSLLQ